MGSSLYVTLFSNSCMKACPENTIFEFTMQLAHEIVLGKDSCEVALCKFSCHPSNVGILKPHAVFFDTNALIYCDLITSQIISHSKLPCLRT